MNLSTHFNITRFYLLLKMELFRSRKGIAMTLVIILGLLFTGLVAESIFGNEKVFSSHEGSYAFNLIVGGFILSSLAFRDLGNTLKAYQYLTLPASVFEKFFSMWLLTTLGWIIGFTIVFMLYAVMGNALGNFFFSHKTYLPFDLFSEVPLNALKTYFILQGVFLVGAVHFKGYVFPKTLFTLILAAAACGIIAYFIMADLFRHGEEDLFNPELLMDMPVYQVWLVIQWLFCWVLAPLCWVITYFGLKEKEV